MLLTVISPGSPVMWASAYHRSTDRPPHPRTAHRGLVIAVESFDRDDDPICTVLWNRPAPWPLRLDPDGTYRDDEGTVTLGRWFLHDLALVSFT